MRRRITLDTIRIVWEPDQLGSLDYADETGEDSYCEGCYARAEVSYLIGMRGERRIEHLQSGGCWGIVDAVQPYRSEIAREELADLRRHLLAFGVDCSAWDELVSNLEAKEMCR
jgi:hypothetical protein